MPRPKSGKPHVSGGGESARRAGLVGVYVALSPEERRQLKRVAGLVEQSMSEMARAAIMAEVKKISGEMLKETGT